MQRLTLFAGIAALAIGSAGCATKKFVRTSVGDVNEKIESLSKSLEQTEERTRSNEGKITEVDRKAQASAQAAQQSARQADQVAQGASKAASRASTIANAAEVKADSLEKASKRLVYEVVLSEDAGNFRFGKSDLPKAAKTELDALVARLKSDPKNVFIEIDGHTDNVGPQAVNEKIGLQRAETVERYLSEAFQIPLHKMDAISYGEEKPVAPNTTRAGRAKNRRVVIRVLA